MPCHAHSFSDFLSVLGSLATQSQVCMLVQKSVRGDPVNVRCMSHGLRVFFQQLVAHVIEYHMLHDTTANRYVGCALFGQNVRHVAT